jgi:hypothetical protein
MANDFTYADAQPGTIIPTYADAQPGTILSSILPTASSAIPSWLTSLQGGAGLIGQYLAQRRGVESQQQLGQQAQAGAQALGQELAAAATGTFKPFTVSTGLGPGISVGQEGGVSVTMPESQMQVAKDIARRGGEQLLGAIGPGTLQAEQERIQGMLLGEGIEGTQQDIFSQLQALRQPEQERQRLALEERLYGQGRTGVRTDMFGGTPEQFAMEKAIQEQQAADALMARQQAGAEQQQRAGLIAQAIGLGGQQQALQAELGLGGVQAAFVPQQQALQLLQPAVSLSDIASRAGLQGVVTQGKLGQSGLEALTGAYGQAAALEQAQLNALVNSLFGTGQQTGSLFGGLFGTETEKTDSQAQLEALGKLFGIGQ